MELDQHEIDYRTCFSTPVGRRVLGNILANAGLFDTGHKTPEQSAVENFAKTILESMGLFGAKNAHKVDQITNAIIDIQTG